MALNDSCFVPADGHLDPDETLPFGAKLGEFMADDCLVICLDDEFHSDEMTMRPSDVVAPWHLRSPGGGAPCNYLFVRGENHCTGQRFVKWNTAPQIGLLRRIAYAPPTEGTSVPITYTVNKPTVETRFGLSMKSDFMKGVSVKIDSLTSKGAAQSAGLQVGDTVISINGKAVTSPTHGATLLKAAVGEVKIIVTREVPAGEVNVQYGHKPGVADVPGTAAAAPKDVSPEQLFAMATEVALKTDVSATLPGAAELDPFRTHAIVRRFNLNPLHTPTA